MEGSHRMKIKTRGAPDPGGKVVDIFPADGLLTLILFVAGSDTTREALAARVVAALRDLAESGSRILSDRDMPVWFVQVAEREEIPALTGVGFPARMASKVFLRLLEPLSRMDDFWLAEGGQLEELDATPLLRYWHKRVIAYSDPMAAPEPRPDGVDELRSADVPGRLLRRGSTPAVGSPTQETTDHSVTSWADLSSETETWVQELLQPLSYAGLRRMIEQLGIAVHEEPNLASVGKYGSLRTGWRFGGETCSLRILLAPHHHDDLKYMILAHELGHYCRHFPLLYHAQLVEELSWAFPEVRLLYELLVDLKLTYANISLEDDANTFASSLLIPPRVLHTDVSSIFVRDRPLRGEELIFMGLQRLFPGRRERYQALSLDELRAAADEGTSRGDLASADDSSLYADMLRASLARMDGADTQMSEGVAEAIAEVVGIHSRHLRQWFEEAADTGPENRRAWWQRLLLELEVDQIAPPPHDMEAELEAGGRKVVVPPLDWDGSSLYPCLPLIPASYNLDGAPDGDWRCLIDSGQPPGTVDEYLQEEHGMGLVLYRLESWQREQLDRARGR
jgi:hypothetical protein